MNNLSFFFFYIAYCASIILVMSSLTHLNVDITINSENFPFNSVNNFELTNLYCSESMRFLDSLPNLEIISEISKFSNLQSADIDINMAFQTDSK